MNLERLARELPRNPRLIKNVEEEIDRMSRLDSCSSLFELQMSKVPAVHIFLCKILEMRIKRKIGTLDLQEEIQFTAQLLNTRPSYQVVEVYGTLGLFCWPALMPSFVEDVISLLGCETGYQILLSFLEKVNTSTTIDEKRRTELKKAISMISQHILGNFRREFACIIIPIYTELLRILPKNFDFSLVFDKASEYPEEAISFMVEASQFIDQNRVVDLLDSIPSDTGMVQMLSSIKMSRVSKPEKVYEYVFKSLSSDTYCFISAIDFWQKVFSSRSHLDMAEPVLAEIVKVYMATEDEFREEADQHIFGFFSVMARNYPSHLVEFLRLNGDSLPARISSNFIQKLLRAQSSSILSGLSFKNPYLNCLVSFSREDPQAPSLLFSLDFCDKDSVKLALSIMSKYQFTSDQLMYILKMCEGSCLNANEIKVECYVKLGMHDAFDGQWNMDKVIKYFYYLKKMPENYIKYKDSFYSLFLQSAPFDRCFAIVERLGPAPDAILQSIYDNMHKYPYIDLCCFNNDLLIHMENPKLFIDREVLRFVSEWNTITDHKEYYLAVKSALMVLSAKIESTDIVDSLLDLIQIDSSLILSRVLSVFSSYKGEYNIRKAVYFLICAYNLPNVSDSQPMISGSLTDCLCKDGGPGAFNDILGIDINRCNEVRQQITKCNRKTAQNMVRDLIKDFRGKAFSKMFEEGAKVTKQDFLPQASSNTDYSLDGLGFI